LNGARSGSFAVERRAPLEGLSSFVVDSQLWVAAAVTSLAAYTVRELGIARPEHALSGVFFSTLFIYNLDRSLDLAKGGDAARSHRARWLAGGAIACLAITLTRGPLLPALVVLGGGALCSLYAVPLGKRRFRLKDVPGTKSLFVGSSVAAAVIVVPLAHAESFRLAPGALWLFVFVVTLTTLNATLFDVRDLGQDRAGGLRSLPVLLGERRTRALLFVGAAVGFGAVVYGAPALRLPSAACWALCTVYCLALSPSSPRSAYAWLVDGALFVPWLLG
jgi:hypothetical protein